MLQSVGEMEPVGRGRPSRRAGKSASADSDAAAACFRIYLGKRQRWARRPSTSEMTIAKFSPTCTGKTRSWTRFRVSARMPRGKIVWDGIRMEGPYSWRPPSYWSDNRYQGSNGSCAEQGDNESIPPYESLKKFIPADKLWPINEWWHYHAGSTDRNSTSGKCRASR